MKKIIVISIIFLPLIANWQGHPLWVGYESTEYPRTPGIQGKIDKEFIGHFLPKRPIIVEAGAHTGGDTFDMAQLWPRSTIYAFEPVPGLLHKAKRRTKKQKNVYLFPLALSNTKGYAELFISSGYSNASSSLLTPKEHLVDHPEVLFNEQIIVETITLDEWAYNKSITKVDFLWLDMQGMELEVLKASPNILKTVKVIFTEVSLSEQYAGAALYPEYKQWLEQHGFGVVREDLPWKDGGDALFIRRN